MFKRIIFILIFINVMLFGNTITVAVAANVTYAIPNLIKEFNKKYPDIEVKTILGSSGKLTAQIVKGANIDIFMSANMKYPNYLFSHKMAKTKPVVYAKGVLALLSPKKTNLSKGIYLLLDKDIKAVATANPKTAPYGIAAKDAMQKSGIYKKIKHKFVYGESISQTLSYTMMAADIGLVAKSSLFSPKMAKYKKGTNWVDIDKTLYKPIKQGIVMLNQKSETKMFYEFILSDDAKKIFEEFGYMLP